MRQAPLSRTDRATLISFDGGIAEPVMCQRSVTVQFYVLGHMDTALASGLHTPIPKGDPERLSARVLQNLGRDVGVVYYPSFWRPAAAALSSYTVVDLQTHNLFAWARVDRLMRRRHRP